MRALWPVRILCDTSVTILCGTSVTILCDTSVTIFLCCPSCLVHITLPGRAIRVLAWEGIKTYCLRQRRGADMQQVGCESITHQVPSFGPPWSYRCSWYVAFTPISRECTAWCLFNPLNAELNPTCHLLTLLGAHHILHVSVLRVNCVCCYDAVTGYEVIWRWIRSKERKRYDELKGIRQMYRVLYGSFISRETQKLVNFWLASSPTGFEPRCLYVMRWVTPSLPPKKINSQLADVFLFRGLKNFHLLYTVVKSEFRDVGHVKWHWSTVAVNGWRNQAHSWITNLERSVICNFHG